MLAAVFPAAGEGSREINADDNSARSFLRAFFDGGQGMYYQPFYVYMKADEKMYIGTSVYERESYEISVTNPSGTVTTYNVTQTGNGHIQTRAQELAGPKPLNNTGYAPVTYTADSEGIYTVRFYGNDNATSDFAQIYNFEEWNSSPKTWNIAAWDITVVSANGAKFDGRVFMSEISLMSMTTPSLTYTVSPSAYILTENGYLYKMTSNGAHPVSYSLYSSNMGVTVNNHSAYTSCNNGSPGYSTFYRTDFVRQSNGAIENRMFYNKPDSALLTYLGLPANGTPIIPEISNLKFTGTSNSINSMYANESGTFTFDSTTNGEKYILTLNFGSDNEVKKYGVTSAINSIFWNGKDANGNHIQTGDFTAKLELLPGETHIIISDFETISNGIVIQRLNGSSSDRYKVFYNHTPQLVDGYKNFMDTYCGNTETNCVGGYNLVDYVSQGGWIVDGDNPTIRYVTTPLDGTAGIDSSSGVSKTANQWSNAKYLDFWTYDDSILPLNINIKVISDEKINILVNKLWEDDSNRDGVRPSNISVKLLQNGIELDIATITGSSSNTWTYTFRNLPKYDTDGELFRYNIEEVVE